MRFQTTDIAGVLIVKTEPSQDDRGSFSRLHCRQEFVDRGLMPYPEQSSLSHNRRRATVRGLHFQAPPFAEAKLVCCVTGAIFDVVVDLRHASPTFGRAEWFSLAADRTRMIYVPEGCAHGFQTLEDHTTLLYMISASYRASAARGIRWNDPALGIPWPLAEDALLSERDQSLPLISDIGAIF